MTQWMRRHGITTSTLEYEVLMEKFGSDKDPVLAALERRQKPVEVSLSKRKSPISKDKLMRCVSVTFPDGLQNGLLRKGSPKGKSTHLPSLQR